MIDNLIAILIIIVFIWLVSILIYQVYLSLNTKHDELTSETAYANFDESEVNAFKYYLDKVFITEQELEQEKQFLLRFLELNSESLKRLGDAYEQLETYIEFKLINAPEANQIFLQEHYQQIKPVLADRFELLLNQRLSTKMTYSPCLEENTQNRPISPEAMSLNIRLFKLKQEKFKNKSVRA